MHFDIAPLNLVVLAAIVYFSVLILLRISGKRQMGPTEFVSVLLISNAIQNSMNGGDNSLIGGILLALVLISLSITISFLTYKNKFFRNLFEGIPRLLIHNGKFVEKALHKEFLSILAEPVLLILSLEVPLKRGNRRLFFFYLNFPFFLRVRKRKARWV